MTVNDKLVALIALTALAALSYTPALSFDTSEPLLQG
jgi:hypothetical protein